MADSGNNRVLEYLSDIAPLICKQVSSVGGGSDAVVTAGMAGFVAMVYSNGPIMFTASFDSGKHWTAPIVVIDDGDINIQPRVVVDNINHAWVSWFDNTTSTVKILAQESDRSFSVPVVIASSANGNDLGIDRNTGTLYSVLGQYNYGGVLMRSTDRGITWNFQSPLAAAGYGPIQPSMAVDDLGHLYVAYYLWWL